MIQLDLFATGGGIDLLVGGTPCQSFSVAGKRAGLDGASGLAYHYARLIGEIQPRWFVWENVPGALSSVTYGDQRDFNFLLQQFSIGGNANLGVRYECCWRVLDTQYVRVESFPRAIPQRRRRVFIVGHLATDCRGGCEILLEPEGLRGYPPPRRVKGQGIAGDTETRTGRADGAGYRGGCAVQGSMIGRKDENGPQGDGVGGEVMFTQNCIDRHGVATESIGFDPSPRECLKHQHYELGDTMKNGTCPCHHDAVAIKTECQSFDVLASQSIDHCEKAYEHAETCRSQDSCGVGVAISYDCYNQTAHDEVSFTQRSAASGAEGNDADVKIVIGVNCQGGSTPTVTHERTDTITAATNSSGNDKMCVAIGIGRDAFNSGRNAQMAQSISTEVQPPITAKGPGGVCTNGRQPTEMM